MLQEEIFKDFPKVSRWSDVTSVTVSVAFSSSRYYSPQINEDTTPLIDWKADDQIHISVSVSSTIHSFDESNTYRCLLQAEALYKRALESNPNDCMVLNDFANFKNRTQKLYEEAAELYVDVEIAIDVDVDVDVDVESQ